MDSWLRSPSESRWIDVRRMHFSAVISSSAFAARRPGNSPVQTGKLSGPEHALLAPLSGMMFKQCTVLQIGTLTGGSLCRVTFHLQDKYPTTETKSFLEVVHPAKPVCGLWSNTTAAAIYVWATSSEKKKKKKKKKERKCLRTCAKFPPRTVCL